MNKANEIRDRIVVWTANLVLTLASKQYQEHQNEIQELGWDAYTKQPRGPQPRIPAPIYKKENQNE